MKEHLKATIRPIRLEDIEMVNEIRRMDGVRETITGIISERIAYTEQWFKALSNNDHVLIAECEIDEVKKVVGVIGLHVKSNPRYRHVATVGIMVHSEFQGKGIGKTLLDHVLDLAENWLNIVRVELEVATNNEKAINLYKSCGFSIEGTCKYSSFAYGRFIDHFLLARYCLPKLN